jgi:hypothetical protein
MHSPGTEIPVTALNINIAFSICIFIILEYNGWTTYICEDGYYVGKTIVSDQNVG